MDLIQAIALGIVQGITEWLPISSSGHLVLLQETMGLSVPILFDLTLHLGTLVAVCAYFRGEIIWIVRSVLRMETKSEGFRTAVLLAVGTVPAALAGYFLNDLFENLFQSLLAVGIGFLITAASLAFSKVVGGGKKSVDAARALLIGTFQALAIAPGVSRSGMTISSALLSGVEKGSAFRFSFLLSIPVILGAFVFELPGVQALSLGWDYLAGFLASAFVGYASIGIVKRAVLSDRFSIFSVYCAILGVSLLAYTLA
ncbi:MAG: undecaprenyl-diphosphate phosphatase [Candidatus Methanosuratus sp.]|nr:undecaprenyl-diphosphate phosphatase [Candidatus Methanosuratincola sp.]